MKTKLFAIASALALCGCSSLPSAPQPLPECPKPPPPPAWMMEPEPNLIPLLDRLITPSAKASEPAA